MIPLYNYTVLYCLKLSFRRSGIQVIFVSLKRRKPKQIEQIDKKFFLCDTNYFSCVFNELTTNCVNERNLSLGANAIKIQSSFVCTVGCQFIEGVTAFKTKSLSQRKRFCLVDISVNEKMFYQCVHFASVFYSWFLFVIIDQVYV